MNCPECSSPMTQLPCQTPINYASDIQWQKWRCECGLFAKIEIVFYRENEPAHAVSTES